MPNFTQPPLEAYEILVRSYRWPHAREGERSEFWAVADMKLYGRSLGNDLALIYGFSASSSVWPSFCESKEVALERGHELAILHRDSCYTIESS